MDNQSNEMLAKQQTIAGSVKRQTTSLQVIKIDNGYLINENAFGISNGQRTVYIKDLSEFAKIADELFAIKE